MKNRLFQNNSDIDLMRNLILSLADTPSIVDFEEFIQIQSVQQTTKLWFKDTHLIAFAYVDDFNNLCFEISPDIFNTDLENEIAAWGMNCMKTRNKQVDESNPLDSSCSASNLSRISLLERMGFIQQEVRSIKFCRTVKAPIPFSPLPCGYTIRCVKGKSEITDLVKLHRAAFDTDHMTEEYRLAMMHAPDYDQTLDWVVISADGDLAAFCIGSIDEANPTLGYLDPIGTHPSHRRLGLSAAMISHGLTILKNRGVDQIEFGTSSENIPMQKLALRMGFSIKSESVWFSKEVK